MVIRCLLRSRSSQCKRSRVQSPLTRQTAAIVPELLLLEELLAASNTNDRHQTITLRKAAPLSIASIASLICSSG